MVDEDEILLLAKIQQVKQLFLNGGSISLSLRRRLTPLPDSKQFKRPVEDEIVPEQLRLLFPALVNTQEDSLDDASCMDGESEASTDQEQESPFVLGPLEESQDIGYIPPHVPSCDSVMKIDDFVELVEPVETVILPIFSDPEIKTTNEPIIEEINLIIEKREIAVEKAHPIPSSPIQPPALTPKSKSKIKTKTKNRPGQRLSDLFSIQTDVTDLGNDDGWDIDEISAFLTRDVDLMEIPRLSDED